MASKSEGQPLTENTIVKLHPTAVFSILNSYARRADREGRVIGTLLGTVKGNVVEVSDCFSFPATEGFVDGVKQVTLDLKMAETMYLFHRRINKREQIVGWFATTSSDGSFLTVHSSLIQDYYTTQCKNPVHIVVDTSLTGDNVEVRGFVSRQLAIGTGYVFDDVRVDQEFTDAEATCLYHMINGQGPQAWSDSSVESVVPSERELSLASLEKLMSTLDDLQTYVDGVVEGKLPPLAESGIAIADVLSQLQAVKPEDLTNLFQERSQDLLMVSYLSTLTKTQLKISEKINALL